MAKIVTQKHPKLPYIVRWYKPKQGERWFATKAEAEAFLPEAELTERGGSGETFREYALRWHEQTKAHKRNSYTQKIVWMLEKYIFPAIGDIPLTDITRETCKALILSDEMKAKPATATSVGQLVSAIFNEAVRDKKIPENPARAIRVAYNSKRAELTPVTHKQLSMISAVLREWGLVPWLQYGCGLRMSEAFAVRADSVRENGTVLRVEEQIDSKIVRKGDPAVIPLKLRKEGEFRDIPLPAWLKEKIDKHIADYGIPDNGYLFPAFASGERHPAAYKYRFIRGREMAGCPDLVTHALRHHFASTMLANGVPISDVSRWLGHKHIQITFDTYSHMMPSAIGSARNVSDTAMEAFKAKSVNEEL